MYTIVDEPGELDSLNQAHAAVALFFKGHDCAVCAALLPRLETMLEDHFPLIRLVVVDAGRSAELSAQLSVLSVPALLVYLDGKLFLREVRHINLEGVRVALTRPYRLMFS